MKTLYREGININIQTWTAKRTFLEQKTKYFPSQRSSGIIMTQQHEAKTLHAVNILMSAPAMKSLSLADMITAAFTLGSFSFGSAHVQFKRNKYQFVHHSSHFFAQLEAQSVDFRSLHIQLHHSNSVFQHRILNVSGRRGCGA